MSALLLEIINLLTEGIPAYAEGIGSGLAALAENIFVTVGEGGAMQLSTFGGLAVIFAGIALTLGLSRFVLEWVTSFGN